MNLSLRKFLSIALAKEIESPENPGALEKRVALVPADIGRLTQAGIKVFVEYGAGEGVGFGDREYEQNGAIMQTPKEIYRDKELIIKFKGPSLSSIEKMRKGSTLFCMAHFHSYPNRAKLLQDRCINVVAMEEICESPKVNSDQEILGRLAMAESLKPFFEENTIGSLQVKIIGWSERLHSAIRRCGNRNPRSLQILQPTLSVEELNAVGPNALYFYDSPNFEDRQGILAKLKNNGTHIFDLYEFEQKYGEQAIATYRASHPPAEFGLRRIQCLHETGQAGARYGVELLKENKPTLEIANAKAVVLGYGNVAQGALHELYSQRIKAIHVLGRSHTSKSRIDFWLKDVDLVVNGAEQSPELRGVNFLVSNQHLKELIPDRSVVIDLVGGSATNRSPVEAVISCSFLTEPHFVQEGVTVSALWGWPMMGMMRETAIRYSEQIVDVLIGHEKLIDGLHSLKPGTRQALVCGPFYP
jgi:alanine dehydrogenase